MLWIQTIRAALFSLEEFYHGCGFCLYFALTTLTTHPPSLTFHAGQTYLSTNDMTEVSLSLGAFWQASLTVGMCSHVSPLDIVLTDDRGSNLTGLTVSNDFQCVSVRAGPLYYEDMSDVHVHIPFNGFSNRYSSVFSISIEGMGIHLLSFTVQYNYA